jgi:hypothetical protein
MPNTPKMTIPYPSSTDLVKDGATAMQNLATAVDNKSGLVLLNTTSFSGVSSQSFNDVFSATYDTYVVRGSYVGSGNAGADIRLRVSGADNSAANYERQVANVNDAATSFVRLTGQTSFVNVLGHTTSYNGLDIVEFHRPFNTSPTLLISLGVTDNGTTDVRAVQQYRKHTASTSFTGFSVLVTSGTITGSISVYGYNK